MSRPKPSRCCCVGRTTFCCCCSVRTGASVIGWFNFVVNSLYVGLMVMALHHVKDDLRTNLKLINLATPAPSLIQDVENIEGSGQYTGSFGPPSGEIPLSAECEVNGHMVTSDTCLCEKNLNFKSVNQTVCVGELRDCERCILVYVEEYIVPTLYKSLAIPGILLVFSIVWLTAVESRSIRYVRICGFIYIVVIFLQNVLQLIFLGFGNQKLTLNGFHPISWSVWLVFAVYAAMNVYFIPILYKYLKLRKKEFSEGMDQGLLTSQTAAPVPGRALDVYLEDAFAIDSDGELDVFRFTADDQNHTNYGSNAQNQEVVSTRHEVL